jgi:hypothetical protein
VIDNKFRDSRDSKALTAEQRALETTELLEEKRFIVWAS